MVFCEALRFMYKSLQESETTVYMANIIYQKLSAADCSTSLLSFHNNLKKDGLLDTRELWDGIKFTWDEPERNETLLDIRRYNDELFKLFYRIQSVKPFNKEQRSQRASSVFHVRDQAQRVHQVLSHYCGCRCIPYHQAKLCLRRLYCQNDPSKDNCFQTMLYQSSMCPCPATIRVIDKQYALTLGLPRFLLTHW